MVYLGLKQLFLTTFVIARLANKYIDQYEPSTNKERGYIYKILSIYKDDSIADAAIITANTINKSIIVKKRDIVSSVEVYTQDTEFDLDDDFE